MFVFYRIFFRFATRAKKIQNKAVVNEVISDAVLSKRYKKQTELLEMQLNQQRKRITDLEQLLVMRKDVIIEAKKPVVNNRRRTWAPGHEPLVDFISLEANDTAASVPTTPIMPPPNPRLAEFVHEVDGFDHDLGADFNFGEDHVDMESGPSFSVNGRTGERSMSFLNTPRALRKTCVTLPPSPLAAAPLDKDARIKELEAELAELNQFVKVETMTSNHPE